ncbi:MAG: glycosyltransferase family 2 protein [Aggregatilineales bacterium]
MQTFTVIYVTYNSGATIYSALHSALALQRLEGSVLLRIVVVDNASQDNTLSILTQHFPEVLIVSNKRNLGFAAANTLAMQQLPSDYFGLVNADVRLDRNWLLALWRAFEADERLAVAGSKIFFGESGVLQHAGAMVRPNGLTYHLGAGEYDSGQYDEMRDVDYVMGAALALRGSLAERLGYLHPGYFMYFEETELCARARQMGYRVCYVPTAIAYHDERHSLSGKPSAKYLWRYHRSRYRFAARNLDPRAFCHAERAWLRDSVRDARYRLLLHAARLSQVGLWLRHRWLLTLRA